MNLTKQQYEAVTTDAKRAIVIAGAGSGKTRVLCERVVHLITSCGVEPSSIMAVTFTRKAATEIRNRISQRLFVLHGSDGEREARRIMIGTFHSLAFRMLRSDGGTIGYQTGITIITQDESDSIIKQVLCDFGYLVNDKPRKGVSFSKVRESIDKVYQTGKAEFALYGHEYELVYREYRARLRELNAVDYGGIMLDAYRLFVESPDTVRARWRERIQHIVVDELQDTDGLQFKFLSQLTPPATFFGVGDKRQSIYGWRGARPDLMFREKVDRGNPFYIEYYSLPDTFRCDQAITNAANRLIARNNDPLCTPMNCATGLTGSVVSFSGRTADIETALIELHNKEGYAWRDIAVICRTNRHLGHLWFKLNQGGSVPAYLCGDKFAVTEGNDFKAVHAAMRLCVNRRDNAAFATLRERLGMSAYSYANVRLDAADRKASHYEKWAVGSTNYIRQAIDEANALSDAVLVVESLASALKCDALVSRWWRLFADGMSLQEALTAYALRDSQDDLPTDDQVTLITAHGAKGLEWPCVILAELNDGTWPSSRASKTDDGIEEERRLAYVGTTRAKHLVVLHYRKDTDQQADRKVLPPSRFLPELLHGGLNGDPGETNLRSLRNNGECSAVPTGDHLGGQQRTAECDRVREGTGPVPEGSEAAHEVCGASRPEAGEGA